MVRIRFLLCVVLSLTILVACVNKDILNISNKVEIHSQYSVPIGSYDNNINTFLRSLDTASHPAPDSLYYEGTLYPCNVRYIQFTSTDTITFNVVKDPSQKVRSVEFIILASNGYPTKALAQVYFISGSSVLDSAFVSGPQAIDPGEVNDQGLVVQPSTSKYTVIMPPDFIQKLSLINRVRIRGRIYLTRPDIHHVIFDSAYRINVHIGSRIELLYNTGDL
jgi:hypothetical protein